MSRLFWVVLIIIFATVLRYMFTLYLPMYQVSGDTVSYFLTGKNIIETGVLSDPWRTPVYPLLLILPFVLSGKPIPSELPMSVFSSELWVTRLLQSASAVGMLVMLFFIIRYLTASDRIAGLLSLAVSSSFTLMVNEFGMYTESFATFWLVSIVGMEILLLRKFSAGLFCLFICSCVVGVFLRPFYIFLPFLLLAILWWYHKSTHVFIWGVYGIIAYVACLVFYTQSNGILHQYYGMSRISDINLIGKIFEYNLPLSTDPNDTDIRIIVERFQKEHTIKDPWYILIQNPILYQGTYATKIHQFAVNTIKKSAGIYLYKSLKNIPFAITDTVAIPKNIYRTTIHKGLFDALSALSGLLQLSYVLAIVAVPIYVWDLYKKKTPKGTAMLCLGIICWYQILMSIFGSYDEYARLLSCMIPISYFVSFVVVNRIANRVKRYL